MLKSLFCLVLTLMRVLVFLEIFQNSQEKTCARVTCAQVFSCEFCEISNNTFFTEHLWATASVFLSLLPDKFSIIILSWVRMFSLKIPFSF